VIRSSVAAVAVLGLMAACGTEAATDPAGAAPDAPVSSTPDDDPTGPVKSGAQRVEPQPGMVDVRPYRFEQAKLISGNRVRIFFYQGVPPCSVLDRVDVQYREASIEVTLQVGRDQTDEDTACIELAVYNYVDVELEEPHDGRRIVDGSR
jgi:hypothetical protein